MRNISCYHTIPQVLDGSKTVTRRFGWGLLPREVRRRKAAGEPRVQLQIVEKVQGLKEGKHVRKLRRVEVVKADYRMLSKITKADVRKEGFPDWTVKQFLAFFCKAMRCTPKVIVTRIEWRYID